MKYLDPSFTVGAIPSKAYGQGYDGVFGAACANCGHRKAQHGAADGKCERRDCPCPGYPGYDANGSPVP